MGKRIKHEINTRTDREKLELFISLTLLMQEKDFVKKSRGEIKMTAIYDHKLFDYKSKFENFTYSEFEAFLPNFRPFLLDNEPVYIYSIFNIYEKHIRNNEMRDLARNARERIMTFSKKFIPLEICDLSMNEIEEMMILGENEIENHFTKYTYEDVYDLFINGFYFHLDKVKYDIIMGLNKHALEQLKFFFINYIAEYYGLIAWFSILIKYSFENNFIVFTE